MTGAKPLKLAKIRENKIGSLARGLDVLSQIDAVDLAPDLRRDLHGFLDGESGVVVKIRRRVSERRLPKRQEALDVPALDVCFVRIHVNGEIKEVGDEHPRRLPCMAVPGLQDAHLSPPVLLFTLSVCLLTSLLFGFAPMWQASRTDLNLTLKEGGSGFAARSGKWRRRP